jgi:hypothetical protein
MNGTDFTFEGASACKNTIILLERNEKSYILGFMECEISILYVFSV